MRVILAAVLIASFAGCARHYVQQMESHKQKLMLTTIKETYLLFWPVSYRQTVEVCDLDESNAIKCEEARVDYGDNPL